MYFVSLSEVFLGLQTGYTGSAECRLTMSVVQYARPLSSHRFVAEWPRSTVHVPQDAKEGSLFPYLTKTNQSFLG